MSEHDEQAAFFEWCARVESQYPELHYFYAIPNGGKRNIRTAMSLKADGVKAGVLDTHLPIKRGSYIGLWIEFKYGKNTTTPEQDDWYMFLAQQGHCVEVVYDWQRAAEVAVEYLRLNDDEKFDTPIPF